MPAIPRVIWILGFISLINDASSELIYPLIPLYLSSVLMAGPQIIGIIEGIVEALGSLLRLFSGYLSDKINNRKIWVVAGYSLSNIIKPLLAFAFVWPLVLLLRILDKVGKALRTAPRDALLASSVDPKIRGLAFGLHRAFDNFGAVIGPLVASGLLAMGMSLQHIFIWTILPGILCILLTLMIEEPKNKPFKLPEKHKVPLQWSFKSLPLNFKRYLFVIFLFYLGNSSNMFLLLRAKKLGITEVEIPILWALTSFIAAAFSTPLSSLSDRVGRKTLILSGWLIFTLSYLLMGFFEGNLFLLWFVFGIYGLYMAASEGTEKAFVADISKGQTLGTAYGWFNMITGIALLPASIIFGLLWQHINPIVAFSFSALLSVTASILLITWVK